MERAPQETLTQGLRGTETLSPELATTLREAVQKFTTAYKIRQAAGYEYKHSNAVDGNFALRMQYGQLREEIKRLGRRLDAGEELEEDDYRPLVKKQAAFERSYEKLLQYAQDHAIEIPASEIEPNIDTTTDTTTDTITSAGEESTHLEAEDATMSNMEPSVRSFERSQLTADKYESASSDAETDIAADTNEESDTTTEATLTSEVKRQLLTTLKNYETQIDAFRQTLTDKAVETHPHYEEFKKRVQKLRSLLHGDWREADSVVEQLTTTEQPRIEALYAELHNDLTTQRQDFEEHFGADISAMRDSEELTPNEDETDNTNKTPATKKSGWFDPAFRQAQGIEQHNVTDSTPETDSTEPLPPTEATPVTTDSAVKSDTTPDRTPTSVAPADSTVGNFLENDTEYPRIHPDWQQVNQSATTESASTTTESAPSPTETSAVGAYPDNVEAVPTFMQPWQAAAEAQTDRSENAASNPELVVSYAESEPATTIFGIELPPSGAGHEAAVEELKTAVGKMLLVMDKKSPAREKRAVHNAWSVLHAVTPLSGLTKEQRQNLYELANDLPQVTVEAATAEVKAWQTLQERLPNLSEKMEGADTLSKSNWRRRGKRVLLTAAVLLGTSTATTDTDTSDPRTQMTDLGNASIALADEPTDAATDADTALETPTFTTVPEAARETPDGPVADAAEYHPRPELATELETTDMTPPESMTDNPVEHQLEIDEEIAQTDTPEAPSAIDRFLDTMLERQAIEYRFIPGSKIDTISEAMWDVWQKNANTLQVDSPVSKSQFLSTMWKVISDLEKQPSVHEALTRRMGIESGNIHHIPAETEDAVSERTSYDLLPLFQKMEAQLREISV